MNILRNKKTTILGLSGLVVAALNFYATGDISTLAASLASSLGLILAQDGGV